MKWEPFPAPDLDRVMVIGWQKRNAACEAYWWHHEDITDERGIPMDHPDALYWVRLKDILPPLPEPPK
jgi:N-glycosylase/DNA lyase